VADEGLPKPTRIPLLANGSKYCKRSPFNQGTVFTRKEIEMFVRQLKIPADPSFFTPCSNIDIIQRLLETLKFCYIQTGLPEKIQPIDDLLDLILKS